LLNRARRLSLSEWRQIVRRMMRPDQRHQASIVAGGVAFYGFLSMFPALVALVSGYGLLSDPADVRNQVNVLAGGLPPAVQEVIYREMSQLVSRSHRKLSLEAAISIVGAVWAATKGTKALITALSLAFGQKETRGYVRLNLTAFLFTAGAIVFGVLAVGATILLPPVLGRVGVPRATQHLMWWLRWPALALMMLLGLAVAYHYGPSQAPGKWRWVTPGAVVATVLWMAGTAVFTWFVTTFATSGAVDGSLGVIITLLGWFLLSAHIFIVGAELNAESERLKAGPSGRLRPSERPAPTTGAG
jgi:membrane protein